MTPAEIEALLRERAGEQAALAHEYGLQPPQGYAGGMEICQVADGGRVHYEATDTRYPGLVAVSKHLPGITEAFRQALWDYQHQNKPLPQSVAQPQGTIQQLAMDFG